MITKRHEITTRQCAFLLCLKSGQILGPENGGIGTTLATSRLDEYIKDQIARNPLNSMLKGQDMRHDAGYEPARETREHTRENVRGYGSTGKS